MQLYMLHWKTSSNLLSKRFLVTLWNTEALVTKLGPHSLPLRWLLHQCLPRRTCLKTKILQNLDHWQPWLKMVAWVCMSIRRGALCIWALTAMRQEAIIRCIYLAIVIFMVTVAYDEVGKVCFKATKLNCTWY